MFIQYKNKDFCGFDDIKHQCLYNRHLNLKKTKDELLMKDRCYVKNSNVYSRIFDRYDFYRKVNYKIYGIIDMYRKENLNTSVDLLTKKYEQKIENIIKCGKNGSRVQLSLRIVWDLIFIKEYFIFYTIVFKNKINNGFRKRNRINQKGI